MARKVASASVASQVMNRVNAQMKGDFVTMGSDPKFEITRVPTGSPMIDRLTGGGFARGRHIELFGDWTVGKSLLGYMTLVLAQERGEICSVVDAENIFNSAWFAQLGGNPDELVMFEPKTANQLGKVLRLFLQGDEEVAHVQNVLIDSVASLMTIEELEHDLEAGDARVGSLAKLMSLLLRQVTSGNEDTLFIWTNQWRDKIARIPNLKTTPGGLALGFYASTRLEMTKGTKETEERKVVHDGAWINRKVVTGQWVNVVTKKEKTGARPEVMKSLLLDYDTRCWDIVREVIDLSMEDELIIRTGDYYEIPMSDGTTKRVHGIKRARALIEGDDDTFGLLLAAIEERTEQEMELANG